MTRIKKCFALSELEKFDRFALLVEVVTVIVCARVCVCVRGGGRFVEPTF